MKRRRPRPNIQPAVPEDVEDSPLLYMGELENFDLDKALRESKTRLPELEIVLPESATPIKEFRPATRRRALESIRRPLELLEGPGQSLFLNNKLTLKQNAQLWSDQLLFWQECGLFRRNDPSKVEWKDNAFLRESDEVRDNMYECIRIANEILGVQRAFTLTDNGTAPRHSNCNRFLEFACALAYYYDHGSPDSLFLGRNRELCSANIESKQSQDPAQYLEQLLSYLLLPKKYREVSKETDLLGDDLGFLQKLKGDHLFVEKLISFLSPNVSFSSYTRIRDTLPSAYELLYPLTGIKKGILIRAYDGKLKEEFSDFIARLGWLLSPRNVNSSGEYSVVTESPEFLDNLVSNETCASCTLGPTGHNYHVAMHQEIDPYSGILRLKSKATDSYVGICYVVECRQQNETVLLIDGVDVGDIRFGIEDKLFDLFFQGIHNAAKSSPRTPSKLYFNACVRNASSKSFVSHIQKQGEPITVKLVKQGGNQALSECDKYAPLFKSDVEHLSRDELKRQGEVRDPTEAVREVVRNPFYGIGLRQQHFLDAHHYKTGTVWYPGGPFVADVVEVEL